MKSDATSAMDDEAAHWVARMDADGWSDADERELQGWLQRDPLAAAALLRCQAAWVSLDVEPRQEAAGRRRLGRRELLITGTALAASAVAAVALQLRNPVYETAVGEIRRVPLADGSIATLNTGSRLDIDLSERQRDVRIERGEAWFHVAKNPKRPFVVSAGKIRVVAVGTAFSVRRIPNGAEILVTEGVVETWASGADGHKVRLRAGQKAIVGDNAAIDASTEPPSSVDRALAWRSGKIDLSGKRLDQAIAEFNRYNHRSIVLLDPALAGEQFDGIFQTDDVEGFATAVHESLNVPVDLTAPNEIRIGRRAAPVITS